MYHASVVILGKVIRYFDSPKKAIHHAECLKYLSLESQAMLCSQFSFLHENVLRGRLSHHLKELDSVLKSISEISHTNFRYTLPLQKSAKG